MRGTSSILVATAVALLTSAQSAAACSYADPKSFKEHLSQASSVLIVRLEAAEIEGSGLVRGKIRVVDALKRPDGSGPSYRYVEYSTHWCGGVRLDVGNYFLVATDSYGDTIKLGAADQSIINLNGYYDEHRPEESARTGLLRPIYDFVAGAPLPERFPPSHVIGYTSTVPSPPCPPER